MMYDVRLHAFPSNQLEILGFRKISRNRLEDDEQLPGNSSCYACSWVPEMEPSSSMSLLAKRCLAIHPVFLGFVWMAWRWWTHVTWRKPCWLNFDVL